MPDDREYPYETRAASEQERDEWSDTAENLPHTHVLFYAPALRFEVTLPPWVDPQGWLDEAFVGWNENVSQSSEWWDGPAGCAVMRGTTWDSSANMRQEGTPGGVVLRPTRRTPK